ncbi:MAG TPA: hypothetical protein VGP72_07095 [Planctomycetota bacterium]|jgi:hypothetical protein
MNAPLTDHAEFIHHYGLLRWVLRECVRANPLYAISAALLAYGVMQINAEINPEIGKFGGIVIGLLLLHIYEVAVLAAATVVLRRRQNGGDLHGLMIVAALFLAGSFLALDELIAIKTWLGFVLIPAALLLAAAKLEWYSRLPGVLLPARYRYAILAIIGAHSISSLIGSPAINLSIGMVAARELAWMCGWLSLLLILRLIWLETRHPQTGRVIADDPLQSRWCGAWALVVTTGISIAHLYASDWVFDREPDNMLLLPACTALLASIILLCFRPFEKFGFWACVLIASPAVAVQWLWQASPPFKAAWSLEAWLSPPMQLWFACLLFYVLLARITRHREFYIGLLGPALAPILSAGWHSRRSIPHFRALVCTILGFVALALGMLVSLYRQALLRVLDPLAARAEAKSKVQGS